MAIYTSSISNMNKVLKSNPSIKESNVYLITRSDKVAHSATLNGWNYCNELAPSWDLFKATKAIKAQGEWDKDKFKKFYVPKFIEGLKARNAIATLNEIITKIHNNEDVYLLCFCPNHDMCHRSIVSQILTMRTGEKVIHLEAS